MKYSVYRLVSKSISLCNGLYSALQCEDVYPPDGDDKDGGLSGMFVMKSNSFKKAFFYISRCHSVLIQNVVCCMHVCFSFFLVKFKSVVLD